MPNTIQKNTRNQSMECCKLIAACFVVFIHVKFPGNAGRLVTDLARFAVPMFFAISGYFNYLATPRQIGRRLGSILRLLAAGIVLAVLWRCFSLQVSSLREAYYYIVPSVRAALDMLLLHVSPYAFTGQFWYLLSLIAVYFVLWLYTSFYGEAELTYRPLYSAGFTLFVVYGSLSILLPQAGAEIPYQAYRNGWLTGIPMFLLGLFLHEHETRIWNNFRLSIPKLAGLILLGTALCVLQWKAEVSAEIPLGTLILVPSLLLLMVRCPSLPIRGKWVDGLTGRFGALSTGIYVLHLIAQDAYDLYFLSAVQSIFGGREPWVRPLAVLALSGAAAVLWLGIEELWKKIRRK